MFITVWLFISLSSLSTGSSVNGDDADQQQRLRGKNKTIRKGNVIREDKSHLFLGAMMILVSNPWQFREGRTCSLPELLDSLQVNWLPHNKYPIILLSGTNFFLHYFLHVLYILVIDYVVFIYMSIYFNFFTYRI